MDLSDNNLGSSKLLETKVIYSILYTVHDLAILYSVYSDTQLGTSQNRIKILTTYENLDNSVLHYFLKPLRIFHSEFEACDLITPRFVNL